MAGIKTWTPDHPKIEEMLVRLANGETLRAICREDGMPDRNTVFDMLDAHPDVAAKYARARERQGDAMDDLIQATAEETDPVNAAAARVKIDAYKWRAMKLRPKVYGDLHKVEHTGKDGGPISLLSMSKEDLAKLTDEQLSALVGITERIAGAAPSEE
jgi:hypothetical protein